MELVVECTKKIRVRDSAAEAKGEAEPDNGYFFTRNSLPPFTSFSHPIKHPSNKILTYGVIQCWASGAFPRFFVGIAWFCSWFAWWKGESDHIQTISWIGSYLPHSLLKFDLSFSLFLVDDVRYVRLYDHKPVHVLLQKIEFEMRLPLFFLIGSQHSRPLTKFEEIGIMIDGL